jgi:NTE family protein
MAETAPMRKLLEEHLDFSKLKKNSAQEIYISAVNILTSELKFFTNQEIGIQHVMASSSIPVIFPWQYVDGIPFWDGGLMANTPIFPAIERGATDVIVVLLSPVGGEEVPLPRNRKEAVERAFELSLIGSYQMALHNEIEQTPLRRFVTFFESYGKQEKIKIRTIYPKNSLGLSSIMNFTAKQSDRLIRMGYEDAKEIL